MNAVALNVLLVASNADDAEAVETALTQERTLPCKVECAPSLAAALERLGNVSFDVVLLDHELADAQGLAVFEHVRVAAPDALMLILCSGDDELRAPQVLACGADDHLVKDRLDAYWLARTLHYLIERKATRLALTLSEARFRAMSDASPLGIFVSDIDGECIYTNAAYHKISGLNLEQTLGTN